MIKKEDLVEGVILYLKPELESKYADRHHQANFILDAIEGMVYIKHMEYVPSDSSLVVTFNSVPGKLFRSNSSMWTAAIDSLDDLLNDFEIRQEISKPPITYNRIANLCK
jgi:hypothetical protein